MTCLATPGANALGPQPSDSGRSHALVGLGSVEPDDLGERLEPCDSAEVFVLHEILA